MTIIRWILDPPGTTTPRTEPCSTKFATCGSVGLLECLENEALLVLRDSDTGVGDRERNDFRR